LYASLDVLNYLGTTGDFNSVKSHSFNALVPLFPPCPDAKREEF